MKQKTPILSLIFSIVALGLATYSTYAISSLGVSASNTDDFDQKVRGVISDYVEEQREKAKQPPQPAEPVEVSIDDDPVKGDEDAPVTIVEFSDYECPFCKKYYNETYDQIMENYVDAGKVKYVFRDFPLAFHKNALPAANAAECVRDQAGDDAYFIYHDKLFETSGGLGQENLIALAGEMDIDSEEFEACLTEGRFTDEINADMKAGQDYGARGTPAFFINGRLLSGAQPFSAFETAIEAELNK
jgi:protein-disulfide isomerase